MKKSKDTKGDKKMKLEDNRIFSLIKQAFMFFGISGIGWLMDMTIFTIITHLTPIEATYANIFSSIVAVTFVYITSTKKMFINKENSINLKAKYLIYVIYQILMIVLSSYIIGALAVILANLEYSFVIKFAEIIAKIIVTPFTMVINFLFMKFLIEKV